MTSNFFAHTPPKGSAQWHGLKEHLTKVANLTETSANKLYAGKLGYYAGLWHDLGKYNPDFQEYLKQCALGNKHAKSVPHAIHGAKLAAKLSLAPLAFVIAGHHAGLPDASKLIHNRLANPQTEADYETSTKRLK